MSLDINKLAKECQFSVERRGFRISTYEQLRKVQEEFEELCACIADGNGNKPSHHCPELVCSEEASADLILSTLTFMSSKNMDIERILTIKNEFNKTRL